ncbi:unnamed protein product [Cuscuta campestris]|uniref:YTH domain-containing family protein n=2 Tax=Cuscuta sect. Cleistogrammica TaxID=1824901 RepID=A0A484K5N4_9ASTE|nr:hypothetical protein DM860_002587 [Cuscuta australis]VFQ60983.1 unnamed protein product [Cuscuta campestris]
MYSEGVPEFVIDQSLYYPSGTNYGYFCTGFDSAGNWDDHQRVFGLDGQDMYAGSQSESFPYVYYTPSYGYAQSAYSPYTPGAVVGVDPSYMGTQQYYTIPYENPEFAQSYIPMVMQNESDIVANSKTPFLDSSFSSANIAQSQGLGHKFSSASPIFIPASLGPSSSQTNSFVRGSDSTKSLPGSSKQPVAHGSAPSDSSKGKVAQAPGSVSHGKSSHSQVRISLPPGNGLSNFRPASHDVASVDKLQPKFLHGRVHTDVKVSPAVSSGQNLVPRISRLNSPLVVKAYTTRAGDIDAHGNITISRDQYNHDGFQMDFVTAKFFVIKSYSEDDVHKSIKYGVWSSTPNGNRKLSNAYDDAQRVAAGNSIGCPVFLFFSVNASGQFCGVAEMTGHVDFHRDMDFWQQDKWSGSFPVKWHFVKDVSNSNFRHITLENNEHKPVTNSRDTQEIYYKKGMEMLKLFKNFTSRTSLFDDFLFYESREKIMQEDRAKLLIRSYESPYLVPVLDPPRKFNSIFDSSPSSGGEKTYKHVDLKKAGDTLGAVTEELQAIPSKSLASESEKPVSRVQDTVVSKINLSSSSEKNEANENLSKNGNPKKSGSGGGLPKTNKSVSNEIKKSAARDEQASKLCDPKKSEEEIPEVHEINKNGANESGKIVASSIDDSAVKIGSLTIHAKQPPKSDPRDTVSTSTNTATPVSNQSVDVVTVGSVPVKINACAEPSGFLRVGSIQLDPKSFQCSENTGSGKTAMPKV